MLNQDLQNKLKQVFKPLGIVAYSNCCNYRCSSAYNLDDPAFQGRDFGIYFMKLFLNGMNYEPHPEECYVQYSDHQYLIDNWVEQRNLLVLFCNTLNLANGQFEITQPNSEDKAIKITFAQPLNLEEEEYSDESEDDENEQE
jgi:hypothetical protein